MATKNDVTGDALVTKVSSDAYRDNFDSIFKKPQTVVLPTFPTVEEVIQRKHKFVIDGLDNHIADLRAEKIKQASDVLAANYECFVAQWTIQHPDEDVGDYTLCSQYGESGSKLWIEKRHMAVDNITDK